MVTFPKYLWAVRCSFDISSARIIRPIISDVGVGTPRVAVSFGSVTRLSIIAAA